MSSTSHFSEHMAAVKEKPSRSGPTPDHRHASRTWSPAGSMANVRTGHTATLLRDGRVLVTGGRDLTSTLETAEVFVP